MRKPRDYDAELKALDDKAKALRNRKVQQFGALVIAIGADALPIDMVAGMLLAAVDTKDASTKEAWAKRGAAFFLGSSTAAGGAGGKPAGPPAGDGDAQPDTGTDRA